MCVYVYTHMYNIYVTTIQIKIQNIFINSEVPSCSFSVDIPLQVTSILLSIMLD